ncbi:MAG: ABC transporter ATP-binding protein [Kangiellaceae bacterium]|nr:ABC transporter ATP-binding protein [Kangiellaceae bacterium]
MIQTLKELPSDSATVLESQNPKVVASVRNVSKSYKDNRLGSIKALSDVSLEIYEGEILSLLGPNGAGKTTLINMMLGRLNPSKGKMTLLGLNPGEIALKRQSGAMLQVSGLPDMSTVQEHIKLFQSYYSNPMSYSKVIKIAGLAKIEQRYSKNLSGGQKQRLLFGLSICGDPKLLFLDEPTVGLDISARRSLWEAITELRNNGTSIVLTTHYLEEADQLSDRIVMLNQGKVIKIATPTEIKSQIDIKTIRFCSSVDKEIVKVIPSVKNIRVKRNTSGDNFFEIQSNDPVLTLKTIFSSNLKITGLTVTGAALEDAFLALNQLPNSNSHLDAGEHSND